MSIKKPHLIEFPKIGNSTLGYISVVQNFDVIPFEIKRIFWTYYTPEEIVRGRHAHFLTEMILVAAMGEMIVNTESLKGEIEVFKLNKPNLGIYIPPYYWHTMQYSHNSVQLVLASTIFQENDYIRSYSDFKKLANDSSII